MQLKYAAQVKTNGKHPCTDVINDTGINKPVKCKPGEENIAQKISPVFQEQKWKEIQQAIKIKPPWRNETNIETDFALRGINKENEMITEITNNLIAARSDHLAIYTDAVISSDDRVGMEFYVPEINIERKYRVSDGTSIDTAELMAVTKAVEWIHAYGRTTIGTKRIAIYTDSQNTVRDLDHESHQKQSKNVNIVHELARQCFNDEITLVWIPSHIGILHHDKADQLAKEAINKSKIEIEIRKGVQDIREEIDKLILKNWQESYSDCGKSKEYKQIEPVVSKKIIYSNRNRKKENTITRLRLNKCNVNM